MRSRRNQGAFQMGSSPDAPEPEPPLPPEPPPLPPPPSAKEVNAQGGPSCGEGSAEATGLVRKARRQAVAAGAGHASRAEPDLPCVKTVLERSPTRAA